MASCKDCVHVEVCEDFTKAKLSPKRAEELLPVLREYGRTCDHFKGRSRFVELSDVGDYDTVTTIDEAIDHCYQIATSTDETACAECKAEHMRLCGWLGDLKRRIAAEKALKEREKNGQGTDDRESD